MYRGTHPRSTKIPTSLTKFWPNRSSRIKKDRRYCPSRFCTQQMISTRAGWVVSSRPTISDLAAETAVEFSLLWGCGGLGFGLRLSEGEAYSFNENHISCSRSSPSPSRADIHIGGKLAFAPRLICRNSCCCLNSVYNFDSIMSHIFPVAVHGLWASSLTDARCRWCAAINMPTRLRCLSCALHDLVAFQPLALRLPSTSG